MDAEANSLISALRCLKPCLCECSGPKQRLFRHGPSREKKTSNTEIWAFPAKETYTLGELCQHELMY